MRICVKRGRELARVRRRAARAWRRRAPGSASQSRRRVQQRVGEQAERLQRRRVAERRDRGVDLVAERQPGVGGARQRAVAERR